MFSDLILIQLRNLHAYIQPAINYYSNISSLAFMLLNFRGKNYTYKFSNALKLNAFKFSNYLVSDRAPCRK